MARFVASNCTSSVRSDPDAVVCSTWTPTVWCFRGHVVVDTDELVRKGYESMTDLLELLNMYGTVEIEELGEMSV